MNRSEDSHGMTRRERFFGTVLGTTAPLAVWGAHFFFVYAMVGTGCARGLEAVRVGGVPVLAGSIWLATLAAVALIAWLTWRACIARRGVVDAGLRLVMRVWIGWLGLVGVLYTALPVTLLEVCR